MSGSDELFPVNPERPEEKSSGLSYQPLAVRMRPHTLDGVRGQEHLTGPRALLPRLIASGQFGSLLFHGPPGCGKTTLAEVIAHQSKAQLFRLNAVASNVAELRDCLQTARKLSGPTPILFIDEIHRFNRAQQDLLLPDVEQGHIRLIGATTHNPGFSIIKPLISRSHLFRLKPLAPEIIAETLQAALDDTPRGLGAHQCTVPAEGLAFLARLCEGDLRWAYNALETLVLSHPIGTAIDLAAVEEFARERQIRYDANDDEHYDTISAFIKSIRGGDPDASLYWLAKMLVGGEDPRFIARRLLILASEDIGLADSRALPVAMAGFQACEVIGLPECELHLAHVTVFLATCPKSNSAYLGLQAAKASIRERGAQAVPVWLRDKSGATSRKDGHGQGYRYSHEYPEAISGQTYLLTPETFYQPKDVGSEAAIGERLKRWRELSRNLG